MTKTMTVIGSAFCKASEPKIWPSSVLCFKGQIHRDEFELLMKNPEMHFVASPALDTVVNWLQVSKRCRDCQVLTRFGVNVADLLNLKDVTNSEPFDRKTRPSCCWMQPHQKAG